MPTAPGHLRAGPRGSRTPGCGRRSCRRRRAPEGAAAPRSAGLRRAGAARRPRPMTITSFPIFLLALIPSVYVATFVHECGHTLVARWQGFVVTSMGMGIGRPFLVWEWRGTKVYLARTRSASGMTVSHSRQIYGTAGQWAG